MLKSLLTRVKSDPTTTTLRHEALFENLRKQEYGRLDDGQHVYLDYTGGNLYAESQLEKHLHFLKSNTLGNPHSTNPTSALATHLVKKARDKVLEFFNAKDYYCIFTPNASGALKIIGECYPFHQDAHMLILADNHNSVNGIREYCRHSGGSYQYSPIEVESLEISNDLLISHLHRAKNKNKLFAFPAQSNASGVKHDLKWISYAKNLGWDVLLDAAAFAPSSTLDLQEHKPDFVSVSFYKIFGYPTGLGCLLVRKEAYGKLFKKWFAGGTVSLASVKTPYHFLLDDHKRFENGTINYLDIPALTTGIEYIESIGMDKISARVLSMTEYLNQELRAMQHSTGHNQVEIFGDPQRKNMGGTMIMCFRNPDGSKIPYERIEELANGKKISLRSGCFCNPGLDETNHCLTSDELAQYFTSRDKGDYVDMKNALNKMRGATRISVGLATNKRDLDRFLLFVNDLRDRNIH